MERKCPDCGEITKDPFCPDCKVLTKPAVEKKKEEHGWGKKCFVRIDKDIIDEETANYYLNEIKEKIYSKPFFGGDRKVNVPKRTHFEIGTYRDDLQLEITGIGTDGRCEVCKYFRSLIGFDNTSPYNCPFI